jgi:hypothetical protein
MNIFFFFFFGHSAFAQAGLTAIDLATVPYTVNIVLTLIILIGGNIVQTILPLLLRRHFFHPATSNRIDLVLSDVIRLCHKLINGETAIILSVCFFSFKRLIYVQLNSLNTKPSASYCQ